MEPSASTWISMLQAVFHNEQGLAVAVKNRSISAYCRPVGVHLPAPLRHIQIGVPDARGQAAADLSFLRIDKLATMVA